MLNRFNPSNEEVLEFIKQILKANVVSTVIYSYFENEIIINLKGNIDGEMPI